MKKEEPSLGLSVDTPLFKKKNNVGTLGTENIHQLILCGPKYIYSIPISDYEDFVNTANKNNWEFCVLKKKNTKLLISCSEDYNRFLLFRHSTNF